jgi:hypothetical protein
MRGRGLFGVCKRLYIESRLNISKKKKKKKRRKEIIINKETQKQSEKRGEE